MTASGAYAHVTAEPAGISVDVPAEPRFEDVYRSHYARMVAVARLMVGDLTLAEEVVQDGFVQLYRNWSAVDYPVTYVRIAVVNGCRSHGRKRAVERRYRAPEREPIVVDTTAIAVRDALHLLSPRQRGRGRAPLLRGPAGAGDRRGTRVPSRHGQVVVGAEHDEAEGVAP